MGARPGLTAGLHGSPVRHEPRLLERRRIVGQQVLDHGALEEGVLGVGHNLAQRWGQHLYEGGQGSAPHCLEAQAQGWWGSNFEETRDADEGEGWEGGGGVALLDLRGQEICMEKDRRKSKCGPKAAHSFNALGCAPRAKMLCSAACSAPPALCAIFFASLCYFTKIRAVYLLAGPGGALINVLAHDASLAVPGTLLATRSIGSIYLS